MPLNNKGRQKTQHCFLRAIDQETGLERLSHHFLAGYGKLGGKNQPIAAHSPDHGELGLQSFQLLAEVGTHLAHVFEKAWPLQDFHDLESKAALQRTAAKSRSVHTG